MEKIILASQSPRRKQLLEWAEIPFEIQVQHTAETYPDGLATEEIPVYIAHQKIKTLLEVHPAMHGRFILAADTVVVLENNIIGKPQNRDNAIQILTSLSGKKHRVITGVVIVKNDKIVSFHDVTSVQFHNLTTEEITFYVDKYKPYDKAGAYAIQEWIGVVGIQSIEGDFYNVMGLPVSRVVQALNHWKF